jgi:hypothetical protein
MSRDDLDKAKQRLRIPELWQLLNLPGTPAKSCRCPWREDHNPSFSVFDDGLRWRDFADDESGDAIDFLAHARGLSIANAIAEFKRLAGVTDHTSATPSRFTPSQSPQPSSQNLQPKFDWPACVAAFTPDHTSKLSEWRGYTPKFAAWLQAQNLVGLFDGERIALPVHDSEGFVVGCHWRLKEDGSWRYHPTGTRTAPLIVGDIAQAQNVFAFESPWDMLAILDAQNWHLQPPDVTAAIATRGASNGRLLAGRCHPDAKVYAFAQNDAAGAKWLTTLAAACSCKCFHVVTPEPHKDANDWTRAGATPQEIQAALVAAQPIAVDTAPDLHAAAPRKVSKPFILLPEDDVTDDTPAPFPIECLPPDIALMVHSAAVSLRVPDSLPGLMALALVAASIGKGLVLDWRPGKPPTPANLFIVPTAESGSGKSECYKLVADVFLAFERAMQEQWRQEVMPQLQADLRFHEGQLKKLDRKLGKDSTSAEDAERFRGEMKYHLAQVDELKGKLHEPQISIQDATVEKAATVMHHNDETIFSVSSDARKLVDNLLGRYSANKKLADDGIYLSAFSGDDVKVDRQGRDGVRLANPCLTLLWALQPDALDMLLDEDSLQQGGFLARCLLAHTRAEPQHIGNENQPISEGTRRRWENLIRALLVTYRQPPTLPACEPET